MVGEGEDGRVECHAEKTDKPKSRAHLPNILENDLLFRPRFDQLVNIFIHRQVDEEDHKGDKHDDRAGPY